MAVGGASHEIVGVDPSEGFIAYAQKNAKSTQAHFDVEDAQTLKFNDAAFDDTLALLVMNFVPDHRKAITEMRRVTRPQGTVSACVWDYDQGMQMLRFFWDEAVALDPAIEPKDECHMKLSHRGQLGDLWREAGLINVKEEPLTIEPMRRSMIIGNHLRRKGRDRGAPTSYRFRRTAANSSKRVYASVCLEIAMMVSSN
jgi:SAM-dependent methyltransferase